MKIYAFPGRNQSAFSLIEVLCAIAIMAVLTIVAQPLSTSWRNGSQITKGLISLSGTLQQARQYAISQNTYVWVLISLPQIDTQQPQIVLIASKDGTIPSNWQTNQIVNLGSATDAANYMQLSLIQPIANVSITDAPKSQIAGAPQNTIPLAHLNFSVPRGNSALSFTRGLWFSPRGEAIVNDSIASNIQIALQSRVGASNNEAIVCITGLTGISRVMRP